MRNSPARLADQAALITFGRFTERLVGILAGIALVRLLTKEDYGTFLQVGLIGEICASIVLLGLPQSLLFFLPREPPDRRKRLILQTGLLLGGAALVAALGIDLLRKWMAGALHNPTLASIAPIVAIYTLLLSVDRMVDTALIGLGEARRAGLLAIASSSLLLVATLGPAWRGWPIGWIYLCILAVYGVRLTYFASVVASLRGDGGRLLPAWNAVKDQIGYALPLDGDR